MGEPWNHGPPQVRLANRSLRNVTVWNDGARIGLPCCKRVRACARSFFLEKWSSGPIGGADHSRASEAQISVAANGRLNRAR